MKSNQVPLVAKKEGLRYFIGQWELNVYELFSWNRYTYDDYYAAISKRDRIEDICDKCYVPEEMLDKIKSIDFEFLKQTEETSVNLLDRASNSDIAKKKWYAFRLLRSHYDEWIGYLQ